MDKYRYNENVAGQGHADDKDGFREQSSDKALLNEVTGGDYKYGFVTDIDTEIIPVGLNEDVVRLISRKKGEPDWMLDFRLKAFRYWLTLTPPKWAHLDMPDIDFQAISYYAAPVKKEGPKSLDEVDPELTLCGIADEPTSPALIFCLKYSIEMYCQMSRSRSMMMVFMRLMASNRAARLS